MTKHVGVFEAKSSLSALISEVEQGADVVITRNGKPVALLTRPADQREEQKRQAVQRFLEFAREFRKNGPSLTREEIKEMIEDGRR